MPLAPLSLWIQAALLLLKNLPAVVRAIQQGVHTVTVIVKTEELKGLVQKSDESKDTSELEALYNPKPVTPNPQ